MMYNALLRALTEATDEDEKKKKAKASDKKQKDDPEDDVADENKKDATDDKADAPKPDEEENKDDSVKTDEDKPEDETNPDEPTDDNPEDPNPDEDTEGKDDTDFNFDDDTTDDSNPDGLVDPDDDGSGDGIDTDEEKNIQTNVLTNMSSLDRLLAKRKSYQNFMDLRASVVSLRTRIENNEAAIDPIVRDSSIEDLNSVYSAIDNYIINRFTYMNYEDTLSMYLLLVKKVNDIAEYVKDKRINKDKK